MPLPTIDTLNNMLRPKIEIRDDMPLPTTEILQMPQHIIPSPTFTMKEKLALNDVWVEENEHVPYHVYLSSKSICNPG